MKKAVLISLALLSVGALALLARALPHLVPMISVPLEQAAADSFGGGAESTSVDGVQEARIGWSAVSLAFVSGLAFVIGWVWVPLSRRVLDWAERQPAVKEVFRYKGVRWVSDAPIESIAATGVVALFPVWVLLPGLHHVVGRAIIPVPDHLIAESGASFVMCLPLAIGYALHLRHRRTVEP